ncbi:hypothetical protein L8C07_22720 [Paenibacillus sp. CMAA1739]|uniref:Uncharacterized protein n=1 Tax=Paenibacillus ottowii TaxID=2315729 RepID=A0ABY3B171_9BACL|nr:MULTISPECIES: hypothetical protein [Paenibacillus]NEU29091.1 hypothetical protein [Paenibacillus polymyxa]MDP1512752.1 hypothetical protein [Paenibacillus ottowii]MEC4568769.1 hypothetical protein [Paenibacillus sp. CMAA1739]QDY82538.1 hypothetical protein FQU75_03485 [Paenibacillus polymyxa]TQR95531.1 hypothetical protein FKV70_22710 [Paenibacillus ottowii]
MLASLQGKEVTIHFIDGTCACDGVLDQIDDKFVKYLTQYQMLVIPITSIRTVSIDTKERQPHRVGFAP